MLKLISFIFAVMLLFSGCQSSTLCKCGPECNCKTADCCCEGCENCPGCEL